MKRIAKAAASVFLSLLLLAGAVFTLSGCFGSPNITPRDRYIDARNGFVDALTRGPWRLIPGVEGTDGTKTAVTVDFGEDAEPLMLNVYRAAKDGDLRELCEAVYGDESFSWCAERLGGETYESFPGTADGYLLIDGDINDTFSSIEKLYSVTSDGLIRLTDEYATAERIAVFAEDVEIDGRTVAADKYVLTLERDVLEEIRDSLIPDGLFDRIPDADGELDEVIDRVEGIEELDLKEDSKLTVSFWQVRGATRKAEIAATEEGYAITLTALVKSDADSVRIDFFLSAEEDGKLTFGLPASVSYTEKDGKFDRMFTVDASNAVIPETDNIGVYGGGENYMPEFSGISLRASGTYGEDTLDGGLTAEIEFAGGELTQSFGIRYKAERETPRGPVTFEITPGPELGADVKITGKTEAADYVPGEYDPEDAIRYSEIEGEDGERFGKFTEELTDALTRFGDALSGELGGLYGFEPEDEDDAHVYLAGEDDYFCLYDGGEGYYGKLIDLTLEDGKASVETPEGPLTVDLEERPDTVSVGRTSYVCDYVDTDAYVFICVYEEYEKEGEFSTYYITVYDDDPSASHVEFEIECDYVQDGDEYTFRLPDGDVTFTYREGDETVVIGGKEYFVSGE